MTGYLQRLVDMTPHPLPAASQPVLRSASPIAEIDQRAVINLGPLTAKDAPDLQMPAEIPADHALPPKVHLAGAAHANAPSPPASPPAMVQKFQAAAVFPSAPGLAMPIPAANVRSPAPDISPVARAAPAAISGPSAALSEPTPPTPPPAAVHAPASVVIPTADIPVRATPLPAPPIPVEAGKAAEADPTTKPAKAAEPRPARAKDELAYVSPAERVFHTLRQIAEPVRAPDTADTAGPAIPPAPPPRPVLPAREVRETIREVVREIVSAAPDLAPRPQRQPRTAAEASVIGPLDAPFTSARRLALRWR